MKTSIHLTHYPEPFEASDSSLIDQFHAIRGICNAALSIRNENKTKVRTPLSSMTIYSREDLGLQEYCNTIADEVNIKRILFSLDFDQVAKEKVILNLKLCGSKLGTETPKVMQAVNAGFLQKLPNGKIIVQGYMLDPEDFRIELVPLNPGNGVSFSKVLFNKFSRLNKEILVAVDTVITKELSREGIVRDIVRLIQQDRKSAGFFISDVVNAKVKTSNTLITEVLSQKTFASYINKQTLTNASFFEVITSEKNSIPNHKFAHEIEQIGGLEILFFAN